MSTEPLRGFPDNPLGLRRGSILTSAHVEVAEQLGIPVGQQIAIGWDGTYVCCVQFTWDIDQLVAEIKAGYWIIVGHIDLSDPAISQRFQDTVENNSDTILIF
ncbi:MAG: hypothetical protein RIQ54_86 [Candidatus Parcubacteria bacterium]|jgi:hypothetical protein